MTKFKKGHNSGFQVGNVPHNKKRKCVQPSEKDNKQTLYVRLTRKMTNIVQNVPYKEDIEESVQTSKPAVLLRPKSSVSRKKKSKISNTEKQRTESSTNRMVNVKLNAVMWNTVFKEHSTLNPICNGFLEWDMSKEGRWGLGNSEVAKCDSCPYESKRFKLYEELRTSKRGRKAAKMNIGAQTALSQTPISTSSYRKILLGTNSVAPSTKGLQKRANAVMQKVKDINVKDMKDRRKNLIEIKKLRGSDCPGSVSLQGDAAYNNPIYSGIGRTPYQPATQAVYTIAENETVEKNILAVVAKNKLCSVHPIDPKKNECNDKCSANLAFTKTIGDEYSWAKEALTDLKSDGIEARHLTTDPDSSAFKAAEDLYQEGIKNTEPEHFIDTRHLSDNHRKNIKKNVKILNMMPGKTKKERESLCNRFALDLAARCNAEFKHAIEQFGGNFSKVKSKLSYICDAIPLCYMGNHKLCKNHSFVCKGKDKFWLIKSDFLNRKFKILKNLDNISEIRKCVLYRLGPNALKKTRLNLNTQKVEGFNRCLRRSLPKNVTYTKNFEGRVHSAVHSVNLGPGKSLLTLCKKLDVPIAEGSTVEHSLKSIQKMDKRQKELKKTMEYKLAKSKKRKLLFAAYEAEKEKCDYEKGKLLKSANNSLAAKKQDHGYAKVKKIHRLSKNK